MSIANGLALPNPLSNGTTADAVPVMADFNYLLGVVNRALIDTGGGAGMNAQNTQLHNMASGTSANDAVNLSQLQTYLPLAGGTLTGGLSGTTLSLSSTLNVSGASTLAAISGTTLSLSGAATLSSTLTTAGQIFSNNNIIVGTNAGAGNNVYLNGASGTLRGVGWQTAGAYASDISLQADNATLRYSTSGTHSFNINGTQIAYISSAGLSSAGLFTGGSGIISSGFLNVDTTVPISFSANRNGQAGYHLYNGGAIAEWLIYEPAHATDDKFHIGQLAGGVITDRLVIDTSGNVSLAALSATGNLTVGVGGTLTANGPFVANGTSVMAGVTATGALSLSGALTTGSAANCVGFLGTPSSVKTANYTIAQTDMGTDVTFNGTSLTCTLGSLPDGFACTIANINASSLTIASGTSTLTLSGSTTTGSRTLGQNGEARVQKRNGIIYISGTALT